MEVIIFKTETGTAVMQPFLECGLTALEIGKKDVPAETPFWIVEVSELPAKEPQDELLIDFGRFGDPSGIGGTYVQHE